MDFTTITTSAVVALLVNVIGVFWMKERLKQSIKYEYDQDLEKLKNSLEFELDKKKRLYEGKLAQYKKYYALMDSYSSKSRKDLFNSFNVGLIEILKDPSEENTLNYIQTIMSLQNDVSDVFLAFKNEIGGLRLEAGENLLSLFDQYIDALEVAQSKTVKFLSWMNGNITKFITDPEAINAYIQEFISSEFTVEGKQLQQIQEEMFLEMRRELGIV